MGLIMPERDSQPDSESDARLLANELKVDIIKVELTQILNNMGMYQHITKAVFASRRIAATAVKAGYKLYTGLSGERPLLSGLDGTHFALLKRSNAYYGMKHRLRMMFLYSYAEHRKLLVAGTANKPEFLPSRLPIRVC